MKALLLAAGYGTRLRPITHTLPKPMVPVANRPLIGWAIEACLRAGIRDIIINLHHLPDAIERYVRGSFDAQFHFSFEPEILGSGGAIKKVRALLETSSDFFAANADTLQFPRYEALAKTRRANDAVAALTLRHPPKGDRYTPVFLDNGRVTGFSEGAGEALLFSGAQCISSRLFRWFPEAEEFGIVDDVYKPLLKSERETLAGMVDDSPLWFDIGTATRYAAACRGILDATLSRQLDVVHGSHIDGDSIFDDTARGRAAHSIVGARSVVEGEVRDSVVWDDCRVAPGATLDRCIVAHGVEIESGAYQDVLITSGGVLTPIGM